MPTDTPRGTAGVHETILALVRLIPPGRVATYGQIAAIEGRCTPRMVGYAMASLPSGSGVPWHRVVNSRGAISLPRGDANEAQRALFEAEGVAFDEEGRIHLARFGWQGPGFEQE